MKTSPGIFSHLPRSFDRANLKQNEQRLVDLVGHQVALVVAADRVVEQMFVGFSLQCQFPLPRLQVGRSEMVDVVEPILVVGLAGEDVHLRPVDKGVDERMARAEPCDLLAGGQVRMYRYMSFMQSPVLFLESSRKLSTSSGLAAEDDRRVLHGRAERSPAA